jgi:uncharacterized protein involved in exopolysaccharide biosynthesis
LQTDNISSNLPDNDEITLKQLILIVKGYGREVIRKWWVVLIFVGLCSGGMYYQYTKSKPEYSASLSFTIKTDGGLSFGGLSALLGGAAGNAKLDRLMSFAVSRKIIQTTLFKPIDLNGDTNFFANYLIKDLDFHKAWKKDTTGMKDFLFNLSDAQRLTDPNKFTRRENKVLLTLHDALVGKKAIFSAGYDKKTEIINLSLKTHNEDLSIDLLRAMYATLTDYYLKEATTKDDKSYANLKAQVDSVKRAMDGSTLAAARAEDAGRGTFLMEDREKIEKLKREGMISASVYGEALKNLAMATISKENSVPSIKDLDMPIAPITPEQLSLIKALGIGIALGLFLGSLAVVVRKIFVDALA